MAGDKIQSDDLVMVRPILEKVIAVIRNNRDLIKGYPKSGGMQSTVLTVDSVCDVACNHLFDDYPERFGITKMDGHIIRAFFHNYSRKHWEEVLTDLID